MPKRQKQGKKDKGPKEDAEREEEEDSEDEESAEKPAATADFSPPPRAAESEPAAVAAAPAAEKPESESESESEAEDEDEDAAAVVEEKAAPEPPPKPVFRPHDSYPPISGPETVKYCPIDGLPGDFCQYGPSWEKSKPWCMENCPEYYPELCGVSLDDAKKGADAAAEKAKVKELPGGKKKRDKSPEIQIKKLSRGGRKCVTSIVGLDGFGVKLDAAAKLFKKKFSCGCAVVAGDPGHPETVDIQGDFEEEVVDLIVKEFPDVPRKKILFVEGGTKKKGKSTR